MMMMTEAQLNYYLSVFHKMIMAMQQHGDRSPQAEMQRAKLGGVLKNDPDLFDFIWSKL